MKASATGPSETSETREPASPSEVPEGTKSPAPVAVNSAVALGEKITFGTTIALLDPGRSEIKVGLYRKTLTEKEQKRILAAPAPLRSQILEPDLIVDFKFLAPDSDCSAAQLSSYSVEFRAAPSGFRLPGGHNSMFFFRAISTTRSREGVGLACDWSPGGTVVASVSGFGNGEKNETTSRYRWDLAFQSELFEASLESPDSNSTDIS